MTSTPPACDALGVLAYRTATARSAYPSPLKSAVTRPVEVPRRPVCEMPDDRAGDRARNRAMTAATAVRARAPGCRTIRSSCREGTALPSRESSPSRGGFGRPATQMQSEERVLDARLPVALLEGGSDARRANLPLNGDLE